MMITVRFLGVYRSIVGRDSVTFDVASGKKIIDLVRIVSDRIKKPEFTRVFIDPELQDPRPNSVILVNDKEISALNGLKTDLHEDDEVLFVPMVHGG